jgi:hypothetical protein
LVLLTAGQVAGAGGTGAGLAPSPGPVAGGLVEATRLEVAARPPISSAEGQGLWLVTRAGRVMAFGDARSYGDAHARSAVVGMAATPDGKGYWLATRGGGVYSFGDAGRFGSLGGQHLASPVVGIAATADGKGYWLATRAGPVYGFGDAAGPGPGAGTVLTPPGPGPVVGPVAGPVVGPVVGIAADPATAGFWLATSTGAVLGYNGAPGYGRAQLPSAVVAMAATPDGRGYWVVDSDGRTAPLGDATRHGALNGAYPSAVVGMAVAPGGHGYWLAAANGAVFAYGQAGKVAFPPGSPRVVAIAAAPPGAAPPGLSAGAPGGLSVTTTSLPAVVAGQPYMAQLVASGGTSPYAWAVVGGALPPGLALSEAGVISGTVAPALGGSFDLTVQVTDASATAPLQATANLAVAVDTIAVASAALSQVPRSEVQSQNWSGYVATPGPYTAASGNFTVPSLSPGTPGQGMLSEWVGIDGSDNSSLIQAGVTEIPDPTKTAGFDLLAWWEVLPAANQPITTVTVSPGDEVSITIWQVSGTNWEIRLTDVTNGQSYTQDVSYTGPGTSAEWIVEAPTDSQTRQQLPLAPYSPAVNFSGFSATGSSTAVSEVVMAQEDQQVSTPCALTADGFSVAYGATAPPAP